MCYFSKLEHIAHYSLHSKEPKYSENKHHSCVIAHAHTHTVNRIAWGGEISKMLLKMRVCLISNFARETVPDIRCSIRKWSLTNRVCAQREGRQRMEQHRKLIHFYGYSTIWVIRIRRCVAGRLVCKLSGVQQTADHIRVKYICLKNLNTHVLSVPVHVIGLQTSQQWHTKPRLSFQSPVT